MDRLVPEREGRKSRICCARGEILTGASSLSILSQEIACRVGVGEEAHQVIGRACHDLLCFFRTFLQRLDEIAGLFAG